MAASALSSTPKPATGDVAPADMPDAPPAGLDWSGIAVFAIIVAVLIGFIGASALVG